MGLAVVNEPRSIGEPSAAVLVWWIGLSVISLVNIVAWIVVARGQARRTRGLEPALRSTRRWQLGLSALFVAGCAFRSFLPRAEAQRICLYDAWISAAVISRAVATVAELSLVAQVFSWYTTLTSNFIGSVVEESTWALTASLLVMGLASIVPRYRGARRRLIATVIAFNVAYVMFMCSVDVPMYLRRWRADQARGKTYLSLGQGLADASHRRVVTRAWADWRDEMPWMTLYFSAGVWVSLALVQVRPFRDREDSVATM